MRALSVVPGGADSLTVAEVPEPGYGEHDLLVDGLVVGVCGTDREIASGKYGWVPLLRDRLVLGHESPATNQATATARSLGRGNPDARFHSITETTKDDHGPIGSYLTVPLQNRDTAVRVRAQRSPSPRHSRPLTRRTSVSPTRRAQRACLAWLLAGVLVVLVLGACGDNTVPRGVAAPGASGNVGSLKLRDAVLSDPGADAEFPGYDRGEDALLLVTIVNDGDTDDELVSVTTAAAERVTVQGATTIPTDVTFRFRQAGEVTLRVPVCTPSCTGEPVSDRALLR
jgi:hypothetical protein